MAAWLQMLTVVVLAATPVVELRGAIPLAIFQYELSPLTAYWLSVVGNVLPVPALLLGLTWLMRWSEHQPWLAKPLNWWTSRTKRTHSALFRRLGAVALVAFVAVPLPITGAWTGSLAAVLFGVPFRVAFPLIGLGVVISGAIVTALSLSVRTLN